MFNELVPGDYDVIELVPDGWELTDVTCTGGESTATVGGVRVHLGEGDAVVCTFTNTEIPPEPGSITIIKETDPDGGTGFQFTGDLGDFDLDDDESVTFSDLVPGEYDVIEIVPDGWELVDVSCESLSLIHI